MFSKKTNSRFMCNIYVVNMKWKFITLDHPGFGKHQNVISLYRSCGSFFNMVEMSKDLI